MLPRPFPVISQGALSKASQKSPTMRPSSVASLSRRREQAGGARMAGRSSLGRLWLLPLERGLGTFSMEYRSVKKWTFHVPRCVVRHLRTRKRGIDDAHERPHHATIAPDPLRMTFRVVKLMHLMARS